MLAALLLASIAALAIRRSTGYWQIAAFGFAPDVALFYGAGRGLAHGQIHPRAVGAYNAVHRFWGPIALATLPRSASSRSDSSSARSPGRSTSRLTARSATDFGLAMATSSPDQLTPRAREIVNAARELLEEEGIEALSMRRIGQRLGIRAPSIYKHLPDKDALEAAIISTGFEEQAALFEAALEQPTTRLGRSPARTATSDANTPTSTA